MDFHQPLLQFDWADADLPQIVVNACRAEGLTLSTAESCTGGLVSAGLVSVPGVSATFPGGIISYSNDIKINALGVNPDTLQMFGAVSKETALEMAIGARHYFSTTASIATTGIAGPDGGSDEKPVGLVYIAVSALGHRAIITRNYFLGDREAIRKQATTAAYRLMLRLLA